MEQRNKKADELTIDELNAASGGALYQPLIVVTIMTAVAIRTGIESLVNKFTR